MYKPYPGFNIQILDDDFKEIKERGVKGYLAVKLPLPPFAFLTLYQNDALFLKKYIRHDYFISGDSAYFDSNGFLFICGRADDELKLKGVRIGANEIE